MSNVIIKDNKKAEKFDRKTAITDYSALAQLILKDLTRNNREDTFFRKYSKEDVLKYLENPDKNEVQLRNIGKYLYNNSSHYRRLINHYSKMLLLNYIIEPYGLNFEKVNAKTFKTSYKKAVDYLEIMNIKHEFQKILTIAFRDDVFYGYEYATEDSYFIQPLNPDYCQISSVEDGCFNFAFNFSFFDKDITKLNNYAPEFIQKYNLYKKDMQNMKWQELDSEKTVCIKVNEDVSYICPIFCGVWEALYNIEDYKSLKKASAETNNYKIIAMQMESRKDSEINNDFIHDLDLYKDFFNKASMSLPSGVGLILTPSPVETLNLANTNSTSNIMNMVSDAVDEFWSSSGTSAILFNEKATSGATLNKAISTDEAIVYGVLRQIERWVNRKLKQEINGNYKFKARFLNQTIYNEEEVISRHITAAQSGVPCKMAICASMGMSTSEVLCMSFLEEDIYNLTEKFKPLQSSHTQSSKDGAGAPSKKGNTEAKTEAGQNIDGNNPENRGD